MTLPSAVDVNVVVPATPVPVTVHEQAAKHNNTTVTQTHENDVRAPQENQTFSRSASRASLARASLARGEIA